jgi:uncharacterized RDD family membrane protein YckC
MEDTRIPALFSDKLRRFNPHETPRLESLAGLPLATFRRRMGAILADLTVVLAVFIPVEFLRHLSEFRAGTHIAINFSFHEIGDLAYFVVYAGLCLWITNGYTFGKRMFGIRVVSLTHDRLTLWQSVERTLGYGASALEGGFGFIQYFIHPNRQCTHDRIAETIVVRDLPAVRP